MASVFISYSFRNQPVRKWVKGLAKALSEENLEVYYDGYRVSLGKGTLSGFMGMASKTDWVVLVCEPSYKVAAEQTAAAGREERLVRAEMDAALSRIHRLHNHGVVPLLREGDEKKSIPDEFRLLQSCDFRRDDDFRQKVAELVEVFRQVDGAATSGGHRVRVLQAHNGMKQSITLLSVANKEDRGRIQEHVDRLRQKYLPSGVPHDAASDTDVVRDVAFEWLRANGEPRTLNWLSERARAVGIPEVELAGKMAGQCRHFGSEDENLGLWCSHREALLEHRTTDLKPSPEFRHQKNETVGELGNMLAQAFLFLGAGKREEAIKTATDIAQSALHTAGIAIVAFHGGSRIAGPEHRFTASLMVPMSGAEAKRFQASSAEATTNARRSSAIFGSIPHEQKLVVVADAFPAPRHVGFWVPVLTARDPLLPGATEAFIDEAGSAVYKCDLPTLGFGEQVTTPWHDYMEKTFSEDFFVSLPYWKTLKQPPPPPVAVLNVNIKPIKEEAGDVRWRRLGHREWRLVAIERVARFARLAYMAYSIIDAAQNPDKRTTFVWEGKDFHFRPWTKLVNKAPRRRTKTLRKSTKRANKSAISVKKTARTRAKPRRERKG